MITFFKVRVKHYSIFKTHILYHFSGILIVIGGNNMNAEFVRERITKLRLQKGVSEYKMSYDLGHSRGYINNISSGKTLPSMTEFFAICEYFSITPAEFFDDKKSDPKLMNALMLDIQQLSKEDSELLCLLTKRLIK